MLTLIQLNPDDQKKPTAYHVRSGQKQVLGRRRGPVTLTDTRISRRHAELSIQNDVWVIRDLDSSNGTWVNGQRITGLCELEEGDRLVLGRTTLIVGHAEVTDADLAAEPDTPPADTESTGGAAIASLADSFDSHDSALAAASPSQPESLSKSSPETPDESGDNALDESDVDLDFELDEISLNFDDDLLDDSAVQAVADDDAEASGDRVALEARAMSNDASSLAPVVDQSDESAAEADASSQAVGAGEGSDAVDQNDDDDVEVDLYTATDDVAVPRRPDSPLDVAGRREQTPVEFDESDPGDAADDDAPPVVGLSLDLPAPAPGSQSERGKISGADDEGGGEEDGSLSDSLDDWLGIEADEIDAADDAGAADLPKTPVLQDTPDTPDTPHTTDEDKPISTSVAASESQSIASARSTAARDQERGSDLLDAETAPDNLAYSSSSRRGRGGREVRGGRGGRGWGKLVAAAVLLLAVGGAAFWALRGGDSDTPIAGLSDTDPLAVNTPGPDASPSNPPPPQTTPTPAPDRAASDTPPGSDPADNRATAKPDPFGQATVLTPPTPAPTPGINPTAPAPTDPADASVADGRPTAPDTGTANTTSAQQDATVPPTTPATGNAPAPGGVVTTPPAPAEPTVAEAAKPAVDEPTPPAPPVAAAVDARRIVFVVDASGSMVDSMNQGALSWLEAHLADLSETDEYTVLFFRSDEVIEVPPVGLKANSDATRQRTLAWIAPSAGNVRPRGKSEPMDALKKAGGYQPTDIYILSDDKFGQRSATASVEARDLEPLLGGLPVVVHTVQFFYPNPDDRRLEQIAKHFGGTYEFVKEPPFDLDGNASDMDLIGLSR